jgi:hypothetical protein
MKKTIYLAILIFFSACTPKPTLFDQLNWFYKPVSEPVLSHDSTAVYFDSLKNETVRWKKADVFNPAAIVRNDTIYVLSRCEDNPAAALGGRTSRRNIRQSGWYTFTSLRNLSLSRTDAFQQYDYPGGCKILV